MSAAPVKIALVALDSQYVHSALAPWCLLAGLREYCAVPFEAAVVEGNVNEPLEGFVERIISEKPDIAGFSCYIWNISAVCRGARMLKAALPGCRVVFGGPEVSYNAAHILRHEHACDFVLSGEGERPFAMLTEALCGVRELASVPGLCFAEHIGEPYVPDDEPPSPYCEEYFAALHGRFAYLELSRGCPFSCAFCLSGRCGGARSFSMERAERELLLLARSGARAVKLVDRTFNANRARARQILSFIIENYGGAIPAGVRFHFEIGGDLLTDEDMALIARAPKGSMQFEIGLQSFNERSLEAVRRKTDVARLAENIRRLLAPGNVHVHIDLIAGLPYEGMESFKESFDRACSLRPHMLQMGFLKLLHGAPMRERPEEYPCEFCPDPPYEVLSTPWLTAEELGRLHRVEAALGKLYNSGRFRRTLEYSEKASGLSPFALFDGFGGSLPPAGAQGLPLGEVAALAYRCFSGLPGVDGDALRDAVALDLLASGCFGSLPLSLRRRSPQLKRAYAALDADPRTRRSKGVRRHLLWLYSQDAAAYADHVAPDPITGEFEIKYYRP